MDRGAPGRGRRGSGVLSSRQRTGFRLRVVEHVCHCPRRKGHRIASVTVGERNARPQDRSATHRETTPMACCTCRGNRTVVSHDSWPSSHALLALGHAVMGPSSLVVAVSKLHQSLTPCRSLQSMQHPGATHPFATTRCGIKPGWGAMRLHWSSTVNPDAIHRTPPFMIFVVTTRSSSPVSHCVCSIYPFVGAADGTGRIPRRPRMPTVVERVHPNIA